MDLIRYDNEYAVSGFGFQNTGVICYFNSMLQGLLSCTSFIQMFKENKDLQNYFTGRLFYYVAQTIYCRCDTHVGGRKDSGIHFTGYIAADYFLHVSKA